MPDDLPDPQIMTLDEAAAFVREWRSDWTENALGFEPYNEWGAVLGHSIDMLLAAAENR